MLIDEREIDAIRSQLDARAGALISELRGASPNKALCSRRELRWGTKGSFAFAISGARAGRWHDFQSDQGGDLIDLIEVELGLKFAEAIEWARGWLGLSAPVAIKEATRAKKRRPPAPLANNDNSRRARDLVFESRDPRETIGEDYLKIERRLGDILDDVLALTIKFHPSCPFGTGRDVTRSPALICALRDPRLAMGICQRLGPLEEIEEAFLRDPAHVLAVQRIRLTTKGEKIERSSLGPMQNGVVFCGSIWESFYSATACIAEGVETALAMRKLGFTGCAALAGAGRFRSFVPPFHWGELVVAGENDAGASEGAWRGAGPRWAKDGHNVKVWAPPAGLKDANDLIIAKAREARAE